MIAQDVENQQKRKCKCINTFEVMKVLDQNALDVRKSILQDANRKSNWRSMDESNLSAPSVTKCARGFSTVQTTQIKYAQKVCKCTFCG